MNTKAYSTGHPPILFKRASPCLMKVFGNELEVMARQRLERAEGSALTLSES